MGNPLEDLQAIRNNPLDDLKDIRSQVNRTSTPSPAEAARARLASRGITPEQVKVRQLPPAKSYSTFGELQDPTNFPTTKQVLSTVGDRSLSMAKSMVHVPTSPEDALLSLEPSGALRTTVEAPSVVSSTYKKRLAQGDTPLKAGVHAALSPLPFGTTSSDLVAPTEASLQNRPVTNKDNLAAAGGIGDIGGVAGIAGAFKAAPAFKNALPESTSSNLINSWLGKGAIDTELGKNAGRGIAKAKIVAATDEGVHSGVKEAINHRQIQLKQMLDTPLANAPAIDGNALLKGAFDTPPLNMPRTALQGWNEMRANIATKMQEMTGGTNQLTPVQADALKNEIDVNFGRLSADATELNLNQKSGSIRRMFDHAVDKTVPGYKELNDHLADLHHADKILVQKIAENAEAPSFSLNPKALVRGAFADTLSSGGPHGTRPGLLTTPGRTALASILSQPPNIPRTVGGMVANPPVPTEGSFSAPPSDLPAGGFRGGTTYNPPNLNPKLLPPPSGITVTPQGTAIPQLDMSTGMAGGVSERPRVFTPTSASGAGAPTNIDPLHSAIQAGDTYLGELRSGSRPSGIDYKSPEYRSKFAAMFDAMRTPPEVNTTEPPITDPVSARFQQTEGLLNNKTEAKVADLTSRPSAVRPEIVEANRQHNGNAIKYLNEKYPLGGSAGAPPKTFKLYPSTDTPTTEPVTTKVVQTPAKPTHVTEGTQVSGIDEQGNLISGNLEKLYPMVGEDGQPTWKGTILDLRNSRTMDLPADRIFDRLSGPPKSATPPKPRAATAPTPTPVAAPKSKLDTLLEQFDDEIPEALDPKQAELERAVVPKAVPATNKKTITAPPLDKGEAAKKAIQDWLDKKALADMEDQLGAGKRKPKGKR